MVLIFALGGLVGNGVVLKVYLKAVKQNPQSSQFYIVLLACIDLYSCVVYLPQIPFLEWGLHSDAHMASQIVLLTHAYLFVQVAMTLDRVFAVFRPHQFNHLRRKTNIGLATLFVFSQLVIQISLFVSILYVDIILDALTFVTLFALGLIVMLVAYPAITIKLYRQNRRIHQAPATATTNPNLAVQQQKNQQLTYEDNQNVFAVPSLFPLPSQQRRQSRHLLCVQRQVSCKRHGPTKQSQGHVTAFLLSITGSSPAHNEPLCEIDECATSL